MQDTFKKIFFLSFLLKQSLPALSREKNKDFDFENHFRVSPVLSHTYIPKATMSGK